MGPACHTHQRSSSSVPAPWPCPSLVPWLGPICCHLDRPTSPHGRNLLASPPTTPPHLQSLPEPCELTHGGAAGPGARPPLRGGCPGAWPPRWCGCPGGAASLAARLAQGCGLPSGAASMRCLRIWLEMEKKRRRRGMAR